MIIIKLNEIIVPPDSLNFALDGSYPKHSEFTRNIRVEQGFMQIGSSALT